MSDKKSVLGIVLVGLVLVSVVIVSAAWQDWLKFGDDNQDLEGELNENVPASVVIQDTSPPNIVFVSDVSGEIAAAVNNVKLKSRTGVDYTKVNFTFVAQQGGNQLGNLNPPATTTCSGYVLKAGESNRNSVSCNFVGVVNWNAGVNNAANYSCQVNMKYYDSPGIWTINISVVDTKAATGRNDTKTFTVLTTAAASTLSNYLNWTNLKATDTNKLSINNVSVSNDGNIAYTASQVNVTNLNGTTTLSEYISGSKFKANGCSGTVLTNEQLVTVVGFSVPEANVDAGSSLNMSFCISDFSGLTLSSQEYKSNRAWIMNFPSA